MTGASERGTLQRVWDSWCGFWFRPADPTPLALMRIVAGLLTLYVHIAYSIDLSSFFGKDAWYSQALAERSYREYPILVPPIDWAATPQRFPMPYHRVLRETIREFVNNIYQRPDGTRVYAFLREWPVSDDRRLQLIRYLRKLSLDPIERDAELVKMVLANADDEETRLALPAWLLESSREVRENRRADIQALFAVLPAEPQRRSWMMTMISLWPPQTYELLAKLADDMKKFHPDPADLQRAWDYCVRWGVPEHYAYTMGHWYYSPFYYISDPRILWFVHCLHLIVIALFTIGFYTRITSVLTWLAALAYIQRNPIILFGQDTMMNLCLFYLMMSPCGAVWSVDALIARYRRAKKALADGKPPTDPGIVPSISAGFVIRLLQVHYCLMYLSAGLSKLKGNSWWNGTAPFYTMNNPEFSPVHIEWFRDFVSFLCQHRVLWELYMNFGVVFTLVVEIAFPFVVWTRLRPWIVAGAIVLHTMIAINMGLIVFSLFMSALLLCWMTPEAIRRVFSRPPTHLPRVRVRFSSRSEPQRKAASLVHALDVWGQSDLQDRTAKERAGKDGEPVEVGVDDAVYTGPSALGAALRSLSVTQSVAWLARPIFSVFARSWFDAPAGPVKDEPKELAAR